MRNRILNEKRLGVAILEVMLTALLLFTACAPKPAVEEKQAVRVGIIAPLTGGAAAVSQYGFRNQIDYLRYFEEVGIPGVSLPPGVTIELSWADCGFEVPRAISAYQRFVERDVAFLYIYNPRALEALKTRCAKDEMPAFAMGVTEALMYPPGWIFTVFPTGSEYFVVLADWIMENWQEERPPRLVFVGIEEPMSRTTALRGGKYAESIGIEVLPDEVVPLVPLDVTPQLLRVGERGADYVYITSVWGVALGVLRDAERLGLTDKIRFGGWENNQGRTLIETLGPAVEGYLSPRAFPWYEEVPFLIDMTMKYRGYIDTEGDGAATLAFMSVVIEVMRIAIEEVGYENLDGRPLKEAFYSIKDFDPHGMGRPVTYTPEDHRGSPVVRIYEVQGGEVVPITDWRDAPMLVPEN
jgi:branched-chain amino acid transport system substrate-binding protein